MLAKVTCNVSRKYINSNNTYQYHVIINFESCKYFIYVDGLGTCGDSSIDENPTNSSIPVIITSDIDSITQNSFICGGNITSSGGSSIKARGICWSKNHNPTIYNNFTQNNTGTGSFKSVISDLDNNSIYYIRAYATNESSTAYGDEKVVKTFADVITDIENNKYYTVSIGSQEWMAENLKTSKFNDGSDIPLVTDATEWRNLTSNAYCWYDNDSITYNSTYGKLYNWYTIDNMSNGARNICPSGWHVPSNSDWEEMIKLLGENIVAGGKLKEQGVKHWNEPNTGATNESGFTALPGSCRNSNGYFFHINDYGFWWSSDAISEKQAFNFHLYHSEEFIVRYDDYKTEGYSVRCIKDSIE